MLGWLTDKIEAARDRSWPWRVWAAILIGVFVVLAAAFVWWRRRAAQRAAHEAFVATVDARRIEDAARLARDERAVTALEAEASAAQDRADVAQLEALRAQDRYAADLAAIDRVRSWDDVGRGR